MRIGLPSMDGSGMDSLVCEHFGHAPYFTVVDTESNTAVAHESQGHSGGMTPAQRLAQLNVQVVLAGGMGGKAIELLGELGIEVFLHATGTVAQALAAHREGTLSPAGEAGPCAEPCPPRPGDGGH